MVYQLLYSTRARKQRNSANSGDGARWLLYHSHLKLEFSGCVLTISSKLNQPPCMMKLIQTGFLHCNLGMEEGMKSLNLAGTDRSWNEVVSEEYKKRRRKEKFK